MRHVVVLAGKLDMVFREKLRETAAQDVTEARTQIMRLHDRQIASLKLAIECLEKERRQSAVEANIFHRLRLEIVEIVDADGEITGNLNAGLASAAKKVQRLDAVIIEIEDLIEILEEYNANTVSIMRRRTGAMGNIPDNGGKPGRKRKKTGANGRQLRPESL